MTEIYEHVPEFPFLVADSSHGPQALFKHRDSAEAYADGWLGFSVFDTTPAPLFPEDAEFIMWGSKDEPGFASFVELDDDGERVWAVPGKYGSEIYTEESLVADVIRGDEVTVLRKAS